MANVTVKCMNCKKDINRDSAHKVGAKTYYCDVDCFNEKELTRVKAKEVHKPKSNSDRLALTNYIQLLFLEQGYDKSEIGWNMICSQIKNLMDNYADYDGKHYTNGGIKYALWYMKEIEEVNLFNNEKGSILNLVPFYYDKSKRFWYECDNIKKKVKEIEFDDEIIVIKKSKRLPKNTEIDLSEI